MARGRSGIGVSVSSESPTETEIGVSLSRVRVVVGERVCNASCQDRLRNRTQWRVDGIENIFNMHPALPHDREIQCDASDGGLRDGGFIGTWWLLF